MRKRVIILGVVVLALACLSMSFWMTYSRYCAARQEARESVLKSNLQRIRLGISEYKEDNKSYPSDLKTLVREGYLRTMPYDPMTKRSDTWTPVNTGEGLVNVKSGAHGISSDGKPYNQL